MKIGFACDHAAVDLKNTLLEYLKGKGYECVDYGVNDPTKRVDYPIMGRKVAEAIKAGEVDKGVLVCGTGVGISLAANKVPGIRAGVCSEPYTARMIVEHNNCQTVWWEMSWPRPLWTPFSVPPSRAAAMQSGFRSSRIWKRSCINRKRCNCWKDAPIHLEFWGILHGFFPVALIQ